MYNEKYHSTYRRHPRIKEASGVDYYYYEKDGFLDEFEPDFLIEYEKEKEDCKISIKLHEALGFCWHGLLLFDDAEAPLTYNCPCGFITTSFDEFQEHTYAHNPEYDSDDIVYVAMWDRDDFDEFTDFIEYVHSKIGMVPPDENGVCNSDDIITYEPGQLRGLAIEFLKIISKENNPYA